eukprot:TRINITY_DN108197_c0_g1_i1.p1 TRINITY_DN108197_c0_g1~~TRINITY_DN108197_c0_g1_i1.p1  ORF type:complete len:297 (+),score=53.51 TRINITY_DN108197_c0_g1_i1:42-932(+)
MAAAAGAACEQTIMTDTGAKKAASRSTSAGSCRSDREKTTAPAAASEQGSQEDIIACTLSHSKLSCPVPVRNTFVDVVLSRDPSLDGFFEKRQVRSYPGSEAAELPSMPATPRLEDQPSVLLGSALGAGWLEFWSPSQVEQFPQHQDFQFQHQQQQFQPQFQPHLRQQQLDRQEPYLAQTRWLHPVPPPPPLPPFLSFVEEPRLGSEELPTRGSAGHRAGVCKPCAFIHTKGCESGVECSFCHLCCPGEKTRRRKERMNQRKTASKTHQMSQAVWSCGGGEVFAPEASRFLRPMPR